MIFYNKLVRDKIPGIILSNGETPVTRILEGKEYILQLEKKLDEEVAEYHDSKSIEELADILEVVYALCEGAGYSVEDLLSAYREKNTERGGFSKKIFLIGKE